MKPNLPFSSIINMSFGFMGVQYAFGLQQANMSPIYRYLGAEESSLPWLWLAGPITGLLVQPIIGAMSDRTWHPTLGRRRPYFLIGAILTSIALILMPFSSSILMAAALMWFLDGAANVTMEPFRAFIADKLPEKQRTLGFSVQSFFVGFGQTLANLMPFILPLVGIVVTGASTSGIPDYVKYSFFIGAFSVIASVLWTIYTTNETPPEDMEAFRAANKGSFFTNLSNGFTEVYHAFLDMPKAMRQLWWVKFFTWYGLPLMWQYLGLSIARHCFNAINPTDPGFDEGTKYGGMGLAIFSIACFSISFFLPKISEVLTRRGTHATCLILGFIGFAGMQFTNDLNTTLACMVLVGIAWASIMAMPYVMLAGSVPQERMGVYMGIFNMFIVIPQFISMATVPFFYKTLLGGDPRNALLFCGVCLLAAAASCFLVDENALDTTDKNTNVV
jgi:maltose/moltooligosaccharide transporter